jgi:serine/threonine protein kinase/tetratricopeptide (TPR) repeat protein
MADSAEVPKTSGQALRSSEPGGETLDQIAAVGPTPHAEAADPSSWRTALTSDMLPVAAADPHAATFPPEPVSRGRPPTDGDTSASSTSAGVDKILPAIPGFDILGEIGRGGMGVVFKARQLDLNRLVAIKMVLADKFDRPEDLVRFRLEAEMVARVRHPNVVQVYDSGAWEGHPYLVLEWIDGGTLSAYLTDKPQPQEVGARTIELLARAIHAAHCNGVVHRDLKPGNILVARGADSTSGVAHSALHAASTVNRHNTLSMTITIDGRSVPVTPKIADFGIAKQLVGATHLTETGKILGTPEYMAPEQADGRSDLTGPATDVYALGVILYQMLTGRTPFRGGSGIALLMRVIEEEPRRPRALEPRISRDLETICLKCLEKHPLRRYQTAEGLADDLCAFLESRPISARPVGAAERAWKWAQRRPAIALLSTAAALFFVLGFVGVTWQWHIAAAQRDRAEQAETATSSAKAATDAVNQFLTDDLLAYPALPEFAGGRKLTAEELLIEASARIKGRFVGQPLVAASVHLAIGNSFRQLSRFDLAYDHLTASLDLRRRHLGDTHRDTLEAASDRGLLLVELRKWNEAIPALRQVVAAARTNLRSDDPLTIKAIGRLALGLQDVGQMAEAEALFKEALDSARSALVPDDLQTLAILNDFGIQLQTRKKLAEAEAAFRFAADGRAKALGPTHPGTLESRQNLAVVLDDEGRWTEAKPLCEQVLADKQRVLGPDHIDTLSSENNLASLLERHGEWEAAFVLYDEAYEGFRKALGMDNPVTLRVQSNLGQFMFRFGMRASRPELLARAETILAAVLATRRRVLPANHPDTLQSAHDLGAALTMLGRFDEAEPLLTEALTGRRKALGPGNPDTLQSETNYVQLLIRRQKLAEAIAEANDALAAAGKAGNAEHAQAIVLLCLLVETLEKVQPADALAPAERALVLTAKVHGETGEEWLRARRNVGMVLLDLGRAADAEPHLRAIYDAYRTLGPTDNRAVMAAGKLGACLLAEKRYADAEPLLDQYFLATLGQPGKSKAARVAGEQLIKLYEAWGKPEKAAEVREKLK